VKGIELARIACKSGIVMRLNPIAFGYQFVHAPRETPMASSS